VNLKRRATNASERNVSFADGTELSVDAVIWATGFGLDHTWIDLAVFDSQGGVVHESRRHRHAGPVLPRSAMAAHQGIGAARLGQG